MAEALLNKLGRGRFRAHSAGSRPVGQVNPFALELLQRDGCPTEGLRSKPWDEFAAPEAPHMDFVFTVCDQAAGEACPAWPGQPMTAHWGFEDPAAFQGDDAAKRERFRHVFLQLATRIHLFLELPIEKLDRLKLAEQLHTLGAAA
ncbi:MAG: arsenate reductase ArsC [Betaproteobacteria bacterium]|nr:arsenate reductase ArsC [Betaproteobacteria bacterium]